MTLNITKNRTEKKLLVNLIVLLVVKFGFSLISTIVIFTSKSLGSKRFNIELLSLISYTQGGNVSSLVDPVIYLTSNMSKIQS